MSQRLRTAAALAAIIVTLTSSAAVAHPEPLAEHLGRLPGKAEQVELVGRAVVADASPGRIADVAAFGDYAYLAAFATPECRRGGVYVIDVSDPARPVELTDAFIPAAPGSFVGEGVQVLDLHTASFTGQVLLHNNEVCGPAGPRRERATGSGGLSLWDVTDPRRPRPLARNVGDVTGTRDDPKAATPVHAIHSAFGWSDGDRAYAVIGYDDEQARFDIDIMDITDPRRPRLIAETGLAQFDRATQTPVPSGGRYFNHDFIVREVGGRMLLLSSYWDAGWLILDVDDPRQPRFLRDTDYAAAEPLAATLGLPPGLPPEGNAHQAEFTSDGALFIGADEDFDPFRVLLQITDGPDAGRTFPGTAARDGPEVSGGGQIAGRTVYVGDACTALPPAAARGLVALVERAGCPFQPKADHLTAAGYAAGAVFSAAGPRCNELVTMDVKTGIPFLYFGRTTGLRLLGADTSNPCQASTPAVGTAGRNALLAALFDGWGYVHLYDARTMRELGRYAIAEALDAKFARGFGALTVHEVATDPKRRLAYLSYYSGGLRVLAYDRGGLREVGAYVDPERGNDFWGVQYHEIDGRPFILASDRDTGLWIFRYTGR